jgi:hypothetical protein
MHYWPSMLWSLEPVPVPLGLGIVSPLAPPCCLARSGELWDCPVAGGLPVLLVLSSAAPRRNQPAKTMTTITARIPTAL